MWLKTPNSGSGSTSRTNASLPDDNIVFDPSIQSAHATSQVFPAPSSQETNSARKPSNWRRRDAAEWIGLRGAAICLAPAPSLERLESILCPKAVVT
jgi:hypothetical protein